MALALQNFVAVKETVHYDTKTTNSSFLKVHAILKRMGVENNKFFLKIYDTSLIGVDPFDPNLTKEQKLRISNECMRNIWYFLRECVRIPVSGKAKRYELHLGNLAMTWCFVNRIASYTELPRQNYKTQSALAIILHTFNFTSRNTSFMFLNKDFALCNENLDRLKSMREELPEYLRYDYYFLKGGEKKIDNGNKSFLQNRHTNNKIHTYPTATSESKADKLGRGMTQAVFLMDEFAFTPYIRRIYGSAAPSYSQAALEAKKNNSAYGKIVISTPGNLSEECGIYANKFIGNSTPFNVGFYDKTEKEVREIIDNGSINGFVYIKYYYKELGRDEDYYQRQCVELNGDVEMIRREILLEWAVGNSSSPFSATDLEELELKKHNPIRTEFIMGLFQFNIYEEIDKMMPVVIGVDPSAGVDKDASSIVVRNYITKNVIATFKNPKISIMKFASLINYLGTNMFPNSVIGVERNNTGAGLLELLAEMSVSPKIYRDNRIDDTVEKMDDKGFLEKDVARRRALGIYTHSINRELMFDILAEHVMLNKDVFVCRDLIDEIKQLVRDPKRGKIQAGPGFHDDMVMAFNMSEYVIKFGNNLAQYGLINPEIQEYVDQRRKEYFDKMSSEEFKDRYGVEIKDSKTSHSIQQQHDLAIAKYQQNKSNTTMGDLIARANAGTLNDDDEGSSYMKDFW